MADLHDLSVYKDIREIKQTVAALHGSGGGGTSGGMEARVAKLESDVGHILSDVKDIRASAFDQSKSLGDVRERLSKLETKVDQLPSKDYVFSTVGSAARFIATTISIVSILISAVILFQTQIRQVLHIP